MTTGILLCAHGDGPELIELGATDAEHLATLRGIVGGFVECVTLPVEPTVTLWCNEDGMRLQLPLNPYATAMAGQPILGDVVLAGGADAKGTLQSAPGIERLASNA